jgi:hypothetical protein
MSRIIKRLIISGCKMNIELYESLSSLMISKRSSIENDPEYTSLETINKVVTKATKKTKMSNKLNALDKK